MHPSKLKAIYLSLLLAYICILLPWSIDALKYRPDFMLLVIIYWIIRAPNLCNIGTAWFVGLFVDLASGGIFGQYALVYTIVAFFAVTYQRRLVLFNSVQQLLYVFCLLVIAQVVLLILKIFAGAELLFSWSYFLPSIIGVTLWLLAVLLGLNAGGRVKRA